MSTTTTTPVRRSGRARHAATSIYDDAKKAQEEEQEKRLAEEEDEDDASEENGDAEESNDEQEEEEAEEEDSNSNAPQSDSEDPEEQDQQEEKEDMESEASDNDDSDDEDYAKPVKASSRSPKKSPKKSTPKKTGKIQILAKPSKKRKANTTTSIISPRITKQQASNSTSASANNSTKSIRSALASLATKVLATSELQKPSSTLVSSLLHILSPKLNTAKNTTRNTRTPTLSTQETLHHLSHPPTIYTPALHNLAKTLVQTHNSNPNSAQIQLINLLFRSIGGSKESDLDADGDLQLEELGNEEWGQIITDTVDEMRHTPENCILVCADPDGAVHYSHYLQKVKEMEAAIAMEEENDGGDDENGNGNDKKREKNKVVSLKDVPVASGSLGVREYRKIYQEFWYVLGHVALVDGGMSGASTIVPFSKEEIDDSSESEDEDFQKKKKKQNDANANVTQRFDTEVVRDILSRIVELVTVGQPDVRAAATAAVYSLALAILDKTTYLNEKLQLVTRQFAAAIGGKGNGKEKGKGKGSKSSTSAKAESLRYQIDSLRRTKESLDEIVETLVIKGVFIHRYRDSNMFIRKASIETLGHMVVRRPDMFLKDKYLKYFGWMLSDKDESVRVASLEGLNRPFQEAQLAEKSGKQSSIELTSLEHVAVKFLTRIVDTVIDVHVSVQESGIKLMLSLLRAGLLDDIDDEKMWNQVNILAFDTASTPTVRRDALYFIMEQLEEFDEGNEDADEKGKKRRTSADHSNISDRKIAQRLDAIASWAAHTLTDGEIPIDKIRINLVDHLVDSLRDMPEHKGIVSNWTAMIRAITDDKVAMTSQGNTAGDRADVAKQRVLVQMLACAAKAEVEAVSDPDFLVSDLDPILAARQRETRENTKGSARKSATSKGLNHEALSVALIKTLPNLLGKFKSDSKILESLTLLPRYFVPSVFSLPQRKSDFSALLKMLTDIYLLSTDEQVIMNCARSIRFLSEGDHARSTEAKRSVKRLVSVIHEQVLEHLTEQQEENSVQDDESKDSHRTSSRRKTSVQGLDSDDEDTVDKGASTKIDNETSLYLNLQRARILSWQGIFASYLDGGEDSLEEMCNFVSDGLIQRLSSFQQDSQTVDDDETADKTTDKRWDFSNDRLPIVTAGTVDEGLRFLLALTAQKLSDAQNDNNLVLDDGIDAITEADDEDGDEADVDDHIVSRLRNRLIALVDRCFQNFIDEESGIEYTLAEKMWSTRVQDSGGEIASDLRTLFPREWSNASSPLLRSLAITDDGRLIGGYVRYLKAMEQSSGQSSTLSPLLLSSARAVSTNWKLGNRREAGLLLSHVTSSDGETLEILEALVHFLKVIQPVRFLEAQMASLRESYKDWIDNDPADIDDGNPTDEMMTQFETDEVKHKDLFAKIVEQANLFSASLGAKNKKYLTDEALSTAFAGFMKEGIRFSFSDSEEFMLGSRLSFLSIFIKYVPWVKVDSNHTKAISSYLDEKEMELRTNEEFHDVHEDDLAALEEFRKALGLGASKILAADASTLDEDRSLQSTATPRSAVTPNSRMDYTANSDNDDDADESRDTVNDLSILTPATSAARRSRGSSVGGSSVGSTHSVVSSVRSSLSPLYEEGNEDDSEESPTAGSKRGRFDDSGVSRQSESVISKRSRFDDSVLSKESDSRSASPTTYSRSQSTWEGEHSDLESPHK